MEFSHKSVLLNETIENLNIKEDGIYADLTLGKGGHSKEILKKLSPNGLLIGLDQDKDAIKAARENLKDFSNVLYFNENFENIENVLDEAGFNRIDGALMDIGVSSYQIDNEDRGFSYMKDGPLDMRMNKDNELTAKQIVNDYSLDELWKIFSEYGEERVFQALRIEVNRELEVLENTLEKIVDRLNKNGRLCVITFHSLEDRIVKNKFKEMSKKCICPPDFPVCVCNHEKKVKLISKKPILPSKDELKNNNRSHSAKLRVCERI